jgi:steroid 5-alpha reductase family enzyme
MARALSFCTLAYAAALAAGWAVAHALGPSGQSPLWIALAADLAATLVVFAFSVALDNSSLYDPYWSVAPPVLGAYFALQPTASNANGARQVLVLSFVAFWGVRLTYNFLRGWGGLGHEDWRYADLRRKTGAAYWIVSLLGIHLFPTLLVFAGCLPLYAALAIGTRPLNRLDLLAAAVTSLAIVLEATADAQLRRFRNRPDRKQGEILASGLWAWSRHPNYFGEMLFWWGLFGFALASGPSQLWTGVGALAITLLFRFVSLRLIETRMLERRPGYAEHARNRPLFVPWPARKRRRPSLDL